MKLSELIANAQHLLNEKGDLEVYQASDEEGNNIFEVEEIAHNSSDDPEEDERVVAILWPNDVDLHEDD